MRTLVSILALGFTFLSYSQEPYNQAQLVELDNVVVSTVNADYLAAVQDQNTPQEVALLQMEAVRALGYVGSKRSVPHLWRPFLVGGAGSQLAAKASLHRLDARPPSSVAAATAILRRYMLRHLSA